MVWPPSRPWSETMVSIPLRTQNALEIKGFLGLDSGAPVFGIWSRRPRAQGVGVAPCLLKCLLEALCGCTIRASVRKRGGVKKSMGNKVPWKTAMLIYLPVTSRPLVSLQKEAVLSSCNFTTAHLTACILNCYLP